MELNLRLPPAAPPASPAGSPGPPVLAGRACGGCNVCCVALTIEDPELSKPQGVTCVHNGKGGLCAIYDRRPRTCREFECGWKVLKWVAPTLRPDRSGVLLRPHRDEAGAQRGVVAIVLRRGALNADGLAETLAAAIAGGAPIHLGVPGPPGQPSRRALLNEDLAAEVAAHDRAGFVRALRRIYLALASAPRERPERA